MVLSGGGAKAAAHIGAARALRDAGIVPVHWVATSMGSPVAAMLASGEDPDRVLERFLAVKRSDVLVTRRLVAFRGRVCCDGGSAWNLGGGNLAFRGGD